MPEPAAPSGTVHWVGTGLSCGSGMRVLADTAAGMVVWGRRPERAEALAARWGLTAGVRAYDPAALAAAIGPGDLVVSMLPATEHAGILAGCVAAGAHFACTSYVSGDLLALVPAAARAGLVVLTEAGLDPGIDHVFAHDLVARARTAVGDTGTATFTSYCGGIPAVPNDFRYRFSWAPRGVLSALCAPARYLDHGVPTTVDRPWEAVEARTVAGERFEVYPNRDSVPFVEQYGLPPGWQVDTFVRGTLRLDGWRAAWAPVFADLAGGDPARLDALAADLAARYPTTDADRDRVVLVVTLTVGDWSGEHRLDLVGTEAESAMARCVSLPLAYGAGRILRRETPPGLRRAAETAAEAAGWLDFLRGHGLG
jgi:Saccharopine dehydrogenase C-terminal domain/Saccharopine dehydrogenase NADP binding domain